MKIPVLFQILCVSILLPLAYAETPTLELSMPTTVLYSGSPYYLNLHVVNPGQALTRVQVFTAIHVGTDEFWFHPKWNRYPSALGWKTMDLPAESVTTLEIIPEFSWPDGLGSFCCVTVFSALMHNMELIGSPVSIRFGWSDTPQQAGGIPDDPAIQPLQKCRWVGLILAGCVAAAIGLLVWISAAAAIDGQKSAFK